MRMDFSQNHFALFGLPPRFALDGSELDARYRDLQAQVHPDRHAHLGAVEKRLAMQWSTRVNEAYQTLRQPLARAEYMLAEAGIDVHQERAMSTEFLLAQMALREAVAQAHSASDDDELDRLHRQIRKEITAQYDTLAELLDQGSLTKAAALLRQLMFQEKLLAEVNDALAALDA
ncbi:MAG: Fe-S protein assembly co-chaperone HscB [Sterolibacterium sp.]|nr:Fe-S protein assembly co-chaperone HscB [Sterolibacterium sp.]